MGSETETNEKNSIVNFPLRTRAFKNGNNDVAITYNPQSKRIITDGMDSKPMVGRHINSVTLELMQRGWLTVSDGEW
jgi:hypothetical protein